MSELNLESMRVLIDRMDRYISMKIGTPSGFMGLFNQLEREIISLRSRISALEDMESFYKAEPEHRKDQLKEKLEKGDSRENRRLKEQNVKLLEGCKIVIYEQMVVSPKSVTIFKVEQGKLVIEKSDQPNVLFDQENILSVFNDLKMRLLEKLDNHFVASKSFCNIF